MTSVEQNGPSSVPSLTSDSKMNVFSSRQSISRKRNFTPRLSQLEDEECQRINCQDIDNNDFKSSKSFYDGPNPKRVPPTVQVLKNAFSGDKTASYRVSPVSQISLPGSPYQFINSAGVTNLIPGVNQFLKHGEIIQDYLIFGSGSSVKAIHSPTGQVYTSYLLKNEEAKKVIKIMARLNTAHLHYHEIDCEELSDRIMSDRSELVKVSSVKYVLFTPSESESVHTYASERNDKITERDVYDIFIQVAKLMRFCHTIGILFRDMKPRKLAIEEEEGRKIVRLLRVQDLVVLDDPNDDTVKERFCSPAYVPPEVIVLDREKGTYAGRAADVWGIGIFLYIMLFGKYPFYDKTHTGVFRRIRRANVVFPDCNVSDKNKLLVLSILKKDPRERPSAEQLLDPELFEITDMPCRFKGETRLNDIITKVNMIRENFIAVYQKVEKTEVFTDDLRRRTRWIHSTTRKDMANLRFQLKAILPPEVLDQREEDIRQTFNNWKKWTPMINEIVETRLISIRALIKAEDRRLLKQGVTHPAPTPPDFYINSQILSLELLLPPEIYPPRTDYHPSHNPFEYRVYNHLVKEGRLGFPSVENFGEELKFEEPINFTGKLHQWTQFVETPDGRIPKECYA